jgi:putative exosortase-associated protein (TIGR04073 family)
LFCSTTKSEIKSEGGERIMKRTVKFLFVCVLTVALISVSAQALASGPMQKLGRGAANVLTGWVEIPRQVHDASVDENVLNGLTVGLAKGIGMTLLRAAVGVYEIVTFPAPVPGEYQPILEPEYPFSE